jgi:FimV-like protein
MGSVHAQKPESGTAATYEVRRGDSLFRIARQVLPPKVNIWQMVLALYRANPDAFVGGNINQLPVGRVLNLPSAEVAASVDATQAGREVQALIAKPPAPLPPSLSTAPAQPAKPGIATERPPKPAKGVPLTAPQAEARFQQGLVQERQGDLRGAFAAYLEAGQSGNGGAQKKLGDFYNAGNAVVQRDYETALKWYQKARDQGVEIPKPLTPGIRH